jgi:hypothetical protein
LLDSAGDYKRMKVNAPMHDRRDDLWLHSAAASLAVKALRQERPRAGIPECHVARAGARHRQA